MLLIPCPLQWYDLKLFFKDFIRTPYRRWNFTDRKFCHFGYKDSFSNCLLSFSNFKLSRHRDAASPGPPSKDLYI